jgi:hypothetical protein
MKDELTGVAHHQNRQVNEICSCVSTWMTHDRLLIPSVSFPMISRHNRHFLKDSSFPSFDAPALIVTAANISVGTELLYGV